MGAYGGNYSAVVFSWAVKIVMQARSEGRVSDEMQNLLVEQLATVRGLSAKQIGYATLQVPRPYFHLMWVSVQTFLFVTIWNTGVDLGKDLRGECRTIEGFDMETCYANVIWMILSEFWLIFMFFALYKVAVRLSDPIGNGSSDYDLSVDLDGMWRENLRLFISEGAALPDPEIVRRPVRRLKSQ
mmetsp:Transcript_25693/g.64175  ORF Transcript_25693/g.64175 Transcript_25693/m.64175 type:complete len:185 (+) Transcript_25693:3-557(+)